MSEVRTVVLNAVARIREERGLPAAGASDDTPLGDGGLGLDSLDMATLVAELETVFHKDPFAEGVPRFRTVADLVSLYESDTDP